MNDQAASALGNITVWAWVLYGVAGALIAGLLGYALLSIALWWRDVLVIAWQLARFYVRRRTPVAAISKAGGAQRGAGIDWATVTITMSVAELDAVCGPRLGEVVSQDAVITEQWRAASGDLADALTPRMVAPTRADLPAVRCHRHRTGSSAFPCTCDTPGGTGA